jgi:ribonuclease III
MQTKEIEKIESIVGYHFKNKKFLKQALTHPSYESAGSYERLEFLGDLVLDAVVGIYLFREYPSEEESFLTDLKSAYVNSKYLHNAGVALKIDRFIRHKNCEIPRLDNFIEGLIGAIFLDSGWRKAEVFIRKTILNRKIEPIRNHKNILSGVSKKYFGIDTSYELVSEKGPPHKRKYVFKARIPGRKYVGKGSGVTKKDAEMQAAEDLLLKLERYRFKRLSG